MQHLGGWQENKKRNAFSLVKYKEEMRQTESLIFDGVGEMMNVEAYVKWAGAPENGGKDAAEATKVWNDKYNAPGAVTDLLGPSPKLAKRVAIRTKDLVINRNQEERVKSYTVSDGVKKKATQEDLDKVHLRMQKQSSWPAVGGRGQQT